MHDGAASPDGAALPSLCQECGGLGLEPMLYQLSVLRVMHALLTDRSIRTRARLPAFQDLLKLATKVRKR